MLRAGVFILPILASIATSLWLSKALPTPTSPWHLIGWWVLILACSTTVLFLVDRGARKMLPLAALMQITMVFPDKAPRRFKTALKSGSSVKNLKAQLARAEAGEIGDDLTEATEFILQLATALNTHDARTRGHAERVRAYSDMLAEEMDIAEEDRAKLRWASLLHDIGKLKISTDILNKPGQLDDDEWIAIKQHPVFGEEICAPLLEWLGDWADTIVDHHERYDGNGYPAGKKGEEISFGGRIVNVSDAYDVMTTVRSYKKPMTSAAAREELARHAGSQFDPAVVRAFLSISMGRLRWVAGPLSWLAQMPFLNFLGAVQQVGTAVGVAGLATAATAGIVGAGVIDIPAEPTVPYVAEEGVLAAPDFRSVPENGSTSIEILANDVLSPGVAVTIIEPPKFGTVVLNADLTVTYIPDPDFVGEDTFTYGIVTDGEIGDTTIVTVTVEAPVNEDPIAEADAVATDEDLPILVAVLANDSDPEDRLDTTSLRITFAPLNGVAAVVGSSIEYTPDADFAGTDAFTYAIDDLDGGTAVATVEVVVEPINDPPVVPGPGPLTTDEDTLISFDPVAGATDADDDTVFMSSFDAVSASGGTVAEGSLEYTPPADYSGPDSFDYVATDGNGEFVPITVFITVTPVNDAPVAEDDSYSVAANSSLSVLAPGTLGNDGDVDGDTLTTTVASAPAHGIIVMGTDGSLNYTPDANYAGDDSFTYAVSDGAGGWDVGTVDVTVTNAAPVANDDAGAGFSTAEDTAFTTPNLVANDTDLEDGTPDASTTVVTVPLAPADAGVLVNNGDGTFDFTPDDDWNGDATFSYTVKDSVGAVSNTASVALSVTPVNDAPVAADDSAATARGVGFSKAVPGVMGNDFDADGDSLTAAWVSGPISGGTTVLVFNPDGSYTYTPDPLFVGVDEFTYSVSDGTAPPQVATVFINVNDGISTVTYFLGSGVHSPDLSLFALTAPPSVPLPDYDADTFPGRTIKKGGKEASTDDRKYHQWGLLAGSGALELEGPMTLDLWSSNKSFKPTGKVRLLWWVHDCDATGSACTLLTSGEYIDDPWNGGVPTWVFHSIDLGHLDHNIVPGRMLRVRLASKNDMWVAYDTADYPSRIDFTVANVPPDAVDDVDTIFEDGSATVPAAGNDVDINLDVDSMTIVTPPLNGVAVPRIDGSGIIDYTPDPDWHGVETFTYDICDTSALCSTTPATVTVTVNPINDEPDFTDGGDITVWEDSGDFSLDFWASAIDMGAIDEDVSQDVEDFLIVSNSNPTLFRNLPEVKDDGELKFRPEDDFNGFAVIGVQLQDDGGVVNPGDDDLSPVHFFTITVDPINDEPDFTKGPNDTVLEDAGPQVVAAWATSITPGHPNESSQVVTFNIVSNDFPSLFAVLPSIDSSGNLSYTPADDAFGTAEIVINLSDDGGTANPGDDDTSDDETFKIVVTSVNDTPSFTGGADPSVPEDIGPIVIPGWATDIDKGAPNEAAQTLTFDVTLVETTNPSLFAVDPAVDETTGHLTFTAAFGQTGKATFDVTLRDNGGGADTSPPQAITIEVVPLVGHPADVGVSMVVAPGAQSVGGTVTYTVTVTNSGPYDTTNVTLTNPAVNPDLVLLAATPSQGSCSLGPLDCDLGFLASPGVAVVSIDAEVGLGATDPEPFDVFVTSVRFDPLLGNNGWVTWLTIL